MVLERPQSFARTVLSICSILIISVVSIITIFTIVPSTVSADVVTILTQDFEGGLGTWTITDTNPGEDYDYWGQSDYKAGSGTYSAWCAQIGTQSGGTGTIWSEDFEGSFPSATWSVGDSTSTNGLDYWDDTDYKSHTGLWSAWCADEGAYSTTLYTENFDSGGAIPTGWATYSEGPDTYPWAMVLESGSDYYAECNSDAAGSGTSITEWLYMTEYIDCSEYTSLELQFELNYNYYDGDEFAQVLYATSTSYPDFFILQEWSTEDVSGIQYIDLSPAAGDPQVHLAFRYHGTWDWWMRVDDVIVSGNVLNSATHEYDNYMDAYMAHTIDLTGYTTAELSFYWLMPSVEGSSYDYGRVYIDSTQLGTNFASAQTTWTLQTYDLSSYVGGAHTLKWIFHTDSSLTYEGWYIDDITVTGTGETENAILHQYDDDMDAFLTSPTFDLSGYTSATLSFWYWYDTEVGHDTIRCQYYSGGVWSDCWGPFDGSATGTASDISIPTTATQLRFYFHSDGSIHTYEGVYIDNILLEATTVPALVVDASGSPTSGVAPLSVSFTSSVSGGTPPYSYAWDFGDGATSSEQNPTHTYTTSGMFTATLTVTDSTAPTPQTASDTVTITVIPPLVASASATPTSGTPPLSVSFSGSASGGTPPYSYTWDFESDGVIDSTEQNPSYTYTAAGSYTATLTVTDSYAPAQTATDTVTITVISLLEASASAEPQSGPAPLAVAFTGTATGGTEPYTYYWEFGDGSTSSEQNPTHTYTSAGSYTATLTVTDSTAPTPQTDSDSVLVTVVTSLSVTVSATPTSGPTPLSVAFTSTVSGGTEPYTYAWDFGDGSTSSEQNPTHTYTTSGMFTATLTVTDTSTPVQTVSDSVVISVFLPLTATASATPESGVAPLSVAFTASAGGGTSPYEYYWEFGDDDTSTFQNPTHVYTTPGMYTATLTVTDASDPQQSATDTITITVITPLSVSISASPTAGTAPLTVSFTSSVTGGVSPFTYAWDFGDGSATSTEPNPSHTYTAEGTYTATLVVTDSSDPSLTATDSISISVSPGELADDTPPTISILSPEDGTVVSGAVTIELSADDDDSYEGTVTRIEVYIDDSLLTTMYHMPYSCLWDTTAYTDGDYIIKAMAFDVADNFATDTITVKVNNAGVDEDELIPTSISCELTATEVTLENNLIISGAITPAVEAVTVTITFTLPDNTIITHDTITDTNGAYTFSYIFTASDPLGTWQVKASWEGNDKYLGATSAVQLFVVISPELPSTTLYCEVTPSSITIGDSITIQGAISPPLENVLITLTFVTPNNTIIDLEVTTSTEGTYSTEFTPDYKGWWSVSASWSGNNEYNGATSAEVSFEVKDKAGPQIISVFPQPGATNVSVATKIRLKFDRAMDHELTEAAITLTPQIAVSFAWEGNTLIIIPTTPLNYGTTYEVRIGTEATDAEHNNLLEMYCWSFTTEEGAREPTDKVGAPERKGKEPANYWWIIGILLAALIAVFVILFLLFRKKRKPEDEEMAEEAMARPGGVQQQQQPQEPPGYQGPYGADTYEFPLLQSYQQQYPSQQLQPPPSLPAPSIETPYTVPSVSDAYSLEPPRYLPPEPSKTTIDLRAPAPPKAEVKPPEEPEKVSFEPPSGAPRERMKPRIIEPPETAVTPPSPAETDEEAARRRAERKQELDEIFG